MRRFHFLPLLILLLCSYLLGSPKPSFAQIGTASQLIAEVNGLRATYGLPAYKVNNSLMSAAQNQSSYQAQIGTWTHTGPGGSRPWNRAVAAGYGSGAQVYVSENVAMGINLSPQKVVHEMWQDAVHLETMISPRYTHIGAGVATVGDSVYYTIVVGYIAGAAGSGESAPDNPAPTEVSGTPLPTQVPVEPIAVATPGEDGSIIHVVQWGQFLENIAAAYEIELADLLARNGLSDQAVIYPGDKLLIAAGLTPVGTPEASSSAEHEDSDQSTETPEPTGTPIPATETPFPTLPQQLAMVAPTTVVNSPTSVTTAAENQPAEVEEGDTDYLIFIVLGLALTGGAMILLGNALKQQI